MKAHKPLLALLLGLIAAAALCTPPVMAAAAAQASADGSAIAWGYIAAALATAASVIGAGIAVASVGSAAVGAITEKPELLGRMLILIGLAEGIAIYGLIVSVLILDRLAP
jgi:V/A-type H+-transporting ATPase subunit K